MKKLTVFFGILLLTASSVWSQSNIPLRTLPEDSVYKPTSNIISPVPIAMIEETVLTINFSPSTVSQVIIMDENNNCQVVYSESFTSSTQVNVDLEDESIGKGCYLLWLFAFGEWWEGEFEIEEE